MTDALILGGGLAGSAAACLLARAGMQVRLLERETAPHHKVCGEFLSFEATAHLRQLGVDPLALGAEPIERIRLVSGAIEAETALPFGALGLSRFTLDEALLRRAEADGAGVERGVRVLEVNDRIARTNRGEREATHLLLATGKLPVREQGTPLAGRAADAFIGFKMHYRLAPAAVRRLTGAITLALFEGGYTGLQMVEGGRANLCLILRRQQFLQLGGDWLAVLAWLQETAYLRHILADAEPLFERPATIGNLTYGFHRRDRSNGPMLRLGDQWGMTASLTGDGMAIALRSAFVAAHCLSRGEAADIYHQRLAAETRRQVTRAMGLQSALDSRSLRSAASWLVRLYPPLLAHAAKLTRLPEWKCSS